MTPLYVLGTVVGTRIQWYAKITHAYPNFNEPVLLERESFTNCKTIATNGERRNTGLC